MTKCQCGQTIKIRKDGLIPFHRRPKKFAAGNYAIGAYCVLSRCHAAHLKE